MPDTRIWLRPAASFLSPPPCVTAWKPPAFQKPMLEAMAPTDALLRLDPMARPPEPCLESMCCGVSRGLEGPFTVKSSAMGHTVA